MLLRTRGESPFMRICQASLKDKLNLRVDADALSIEGEVAPFVPANNNGELNFYLELDSNFEYAKNFIICNLNIEKLSLISKSVLEKMILNILSERSIKKIKKSLIT